MTKEETSQSGGQIRRVGRVGMELLKVEFSLDMPLNLLEFLFAFVHVQNLGELKISMNDSKLC